MKNDRKAYLVVLLFAVTACLGALCVPLSGAADEIAAHWGQYISHHTMGELSRYGKIRIIAVSDIPGAAKGQQVPSGLLKVSPAQDFEVQFESEREILLTPARPLSPGTTYTIDVLRAGFKGAPEALGDYEFKVTVIKQEFEVTVEEPVTSADNQQTVDISGVVVVRDREPSEDIEALLNASLDGAPFKLKWEHTEAGLTHNFTANGIKRLQSNSRELELKWNGGALGVEGKGTRIIEVPALDVFAVSEVSAQTEPSRHVRVQFTNPINANLDLKGLVSLSTGKATFRAEGNALLIFPEAVKSGLVKVTLHKGIKSASGQRYDKTTVHDVFFTSIIPSLRFAGKGTILPKNGKLTIPFEAMNVSKVHVTAFQIYDSNMGQFLQTNSLEGSDELYRVGRYLWQKSIPLDRSAANEWGRYLVDVTDFMQKYRGSLIRLSLSFNKEDILYPCTQEDRNIKAPPSVRLDDSDGDRGTKHSSWDYAEEEGVEYGSWRDREDPCKAYFYTANYDKKAVVSRNFIASNIGLTAKRGADNTLLVAATDLRTASPLTETGLKVYNFQNRLIGSGLTDASGFATIAAQGLPFYLAADKEGDIGYLKLSSGLAIPTSHFDVGGEVAADGIKGFIYGERGVWRPGDNIYLTFVLEDKNGLVPDAHPVSMELYDPSGQMVMSKTNAKPVGGFYAFKLKTEESAPTGSWIAVAKLGGRSFSKKLRIETVVPNRLKVELTASADAIYTSSPVFQLFGEWLHGATAAGLKADSKVTLTETPTRFKRYTDYVFDDPTREIKKNEFNILEGALNDKGKVEFTADFPEDLAAPGMLKAQIETRIFEEGGAFSTSTMELTYHPYEKYVGLKLPKGDNARNMLLTDKTHKVSLVTLDSHGQNTDVASINVSLYKIHWKWWWDKSGDERLAEFESSSQHTLVSSGKVSTKGGEGAWTFQVKYPDWGRYLLRACDEEGKHCTGQVFYMDWPGWAGRAQEQRGEGASALTLYTDKTEYTVGESATVVLPGVQKGSLLLSIETASKVLERKWVELKEGQQELKIPVTSRMSPTAYVNISLIQPHSGRNNDLPLRLLGIVPLKVVDPATVLKPVLKVKDEFMPESKAEITVLEKSGRAMTYTLAIVDEGLLGLTNFKTPNLHAEFYKKEALGVSTWDLFDEVVGAYSGELDRLLALGGDESLNIDEEARKQKRFPPMVKFLGPFRLKPGEVRTHDIGVPMYIGAVRVMLVAGEKGSYGFAERSVAVKQPLMVQATLPRVLGPGEQLTVPVTLFSANQSITDVEILMKADPVYFTIKGKNPVKVSFAEQGEKMGFLQLGVNSKLGKSKISIIANTSIYSGHEDIFMPVRSPNPLSVEHRVFTIEPGKILNTTVEPLGLPGSNRALIEVSAMKPLNLEKRLGFLIAYPHGCIEQTTSAVFPQIYLPKFMKLPQAELAKIEKNIKAALEKFQRFQQTGGGFSYWPQGGEASAWGTNYAGHFLLEAERQGYGIPAEMKSAWMGYQKRAAEQWVAGGRSSVHEQAYRLYTLALAGKPELGAMNRLRESGLAMPEAARWHLASAYKLSGLPEAALELVKGLRPEPAARNIHYDDESFGSTLRDKAIVLMGLLQTGDTKRAELFADSLSADLVSDSWLNTQETAYALMAMSQYYGGADQDGKFKYVLMVNGKLPEFIISRSKISRDELSSLAEKGGKVAVLNDDQRRLYATIITEGVPPAGKEADASNSLVMQATFLDRNDAPLDPASVKQTTDIKVELKVRNMTDADLENLAITQIVPSGWQILGNRVSDGVKNDQVDYQDIRDDRVLTYLSLKKRSEKTLYFVFNASFLGKFYLPAWRVEAMYDAYKNAQIKGRWVEVVK